MAVWAVVRKLRSFAVALLFGASLLLVLWLGPLTAGILPPGLATDRLTQARQQNQQGFEWLEQGRAADALHAWQRATQLYQQAGNAEGVMGSQFNQTLALQAIGLMPAACELLTDVLERPSWLCLPLQQTAQLPADALEVLRQHLAEHPAVGIQLIGHRLLGTALRSLGNVAAAELILTHTYHQAVQTGDPAESVRLMQALAATQQTIADQTRDDLLRADTPDAQAELLARLRDAIQSVLDWYQQIIEGSPQVPSAVVQSRLNLVTLAVDFRVWRTAFPWQVMALEELERSVLQAAKTNLDDLVKTPTAFESLSPVDGLYGRLGLARALLRAWEIPQFDRQLWQGQSTQSLDYARTLIQASREQPIVAHNYRLRSFASGLYATLLKAEGAPVEDYLPYYQQATALAQSVQAWDVAYRWQGELARIYRQQGDIAQSIAAYQSTIASLEKVRQNILAVNLDIQLSFREQVEPVYREFMDLLLTQETPNLAEVVNVNESLQVAELENYLRCGKLDYVPFHRLSTLQDSPTIVHIINLPSRTEVIVQSPNNQFHSYSRDPTIVRQAADNLLINLQSPQFVETDPTASLHYAQTLYQELLAPAIESGRIKPDSTLVFVLDSLLQNIPMGMLHDGHAFLIEQYRVAIALSSQVRDPRKLAPDQLKALIAGLSKAGPSFRDPGAPQGLVALPEVEAEIKAIRPYLNSAVELLNEAFTVEQFETSLERTNYPVIHITTHGQFSSDPLQTVLLSWTDLINAPQLNQLIQQAATNGVPDVEMLVLSACQTAKGDRRSTLGIAGLAVQAGARSTIASLWLVDSDSTAVLMSEFYRELAAGKTKAEALRQAQITLLNSSAFSHPFYWSAFILVGNWL